MSRDSAESSDDVVAVVGNKKDRDREASPDPRGLLGPGQSPAGKATVQQQAMQRQQSAEKMQEQIRSQLKEEQRQAKTAPPASAPAPTNVQKPPPPPPPPPQQQPQQPQQPQPVPSTPSAATAVPDKGADKPAAGGVKVRRYLVYLAPI